MADNKLTVYEKAMLVLLVKILGQVGILATDKLTGTVQGNNTSSLVETIEGIKALLKDG